MGTHNIHRSILYGLILLLCAGCIQPAALAPRSPVVIESAAEEPTGPILLVKIISIEDESTGERVAADVLIDGALLANQAGRFEYTIQSSEAHTLTVKAPGYQLFEVVMLPQLDRDKQLVIPLKLQREQ